MATRLTPQQQLFRNIDDARMVRNKRGGQISPTLIAAWKKMLKEQGYTGNTTALGNYKLKCPWCEKGLVAVSNKQHQVTIFQRQDFGNSFTSANGTEFKCPHMNCGELMVATSNKHHEVTLVKVDPVKKFIKLKPSK